VSSRPRATTCRFYERELSPKKLHKMGLAAQPPNVPVVPPSERVAAKPAIREYDPHVGYPPSTKQWYTLVRLDEYGPGASDAELRELEERILSEPDDTSDDDALETLSGASANDEALLEDVEPEHKPHPQHHAAYVKPGGPCDHCGAAGTFRDVCLSLFSCGTVGRVLSRETRREGARGGGRDVPRAPETRPIRASTRLSSATATFADDIPSSSSPSEPAERRLAAVATRARVQADALQRLRHAVPPDEHARPLDARAPRGRGGRAQEEVAPGVALRLESGEEAVRGRGAGRRLRQGRDRRSGVGNQGTRARDDSTREGSEFERARFFALSR
jgi:hypothetical protein